jgi:uncharacterized protein
MQMSSAKDSAPGLLSKLKADFAAKPFTPHGVLTQGDLQTLSAYFWPGRYGAKDLTGDEERLFEVGPGTKVVARCRWQRSRRECPTLLMWHGIEGSTRSAYMLMTAARAFSAGFNVVRVNIRNCGGTEHLTPTLYHGGMSGDARAVIDELINKDGLSRLVIAGFSLGGNKVLKLAGEYAEGPPAQLVGVAAISPSVNLRASSDRLMLARNWIYHQDFLYYLKRRIKTKQKLFPDLYQMNGLRHVRTIRQYDQAYIAPAFGFRDVDDYYAKASSLPYIKRIRIPTLIIHAQDDPFVPFEPLRDPSIAGNPHVLLLAPERGGHVAFISANEDGEDRFWAENRLVDFCRMISRKRRHLEC